MRRIEVTRDGGSLNAVVASAGVAAGRAYSITIADRQYFVEVLEWTDKDLVFRLQGEEVRVPYANLGRGEWIVGNDLIPQGIIARDERESHYAAGASQVEEGALYVNMPGKIVAILVKAGDIVQMGQGLVIVEAMKMENELKAGKSGKVSSIHVEVGATVDSGTLLVEIDD